MLASAASSSIAKNGHEAMRSRGASALVRIGGGNLPDGHSIREWHRTLPFSAIVALAKSGIHDGRASGKATRSRQGTKHLRYVILLLAGAGLMWTLVAVIPAPDTNHPDEPVLRTRRAPQDKEYGGTSRGGRLFVESGWSQHPIQKLIEESRALWKRKLEDQSTTLRQAVNVYMSRYGRLPPKGFDKWWAYSRVMLPDEYDMIYRSTSIFHAFTPQDIRKRINRAKAMPDVFWLAINNGQISNISYFDQAKHPGGRQRLAEQVDLISSVSQWIPDVETVWNVHDTGRILLGHFGREQLEQAADRNESVVEYDADVQEGWIAACKQTGIRTRARSSLVKSFIQDHSTEMDLCNWPENLDIHGATLNRNPKTDDIVPLFSISRNSIQADILGVPYAHSINREPTPWAARPERRALWRGSATGGHYDQHGPWRNTHRLRLVDIVKNGKAESVLGMEVNEVKRTRSQLAKQYLDVSLTGGAIQCDKEDGTCAELEEEYHFSSWMSHAEMARYRYILDVDGNAWSARFRGLLGQENLILKATIMPEWYADRIQPWVHYIPMKIDYSDIFDLLAFFSGDLPGGYEHLQYAQDIAAEGRRWVDSFWRKEDTVAYTFRLYLEWARLCSSDRAQASYSYDPMDEV